MTRKDKALLSVFAATGIAFACIAALTGERPAQNESAFSPEANCASAPLQLAAMQTRADAPTHGGMGGAPIMPFNVADQTQKREGIGLTNFEPTCL